MEKINIQSNINAIGRLNLIVRDKNGKIKSIHNCKNKITTNGLAVMANLMASSPTLTKPSYVEFGTGQGAAANWYVFTISTITGTTLVGDTFTNNSVTFTVVASINSTNTTLVCSGSGAPAASGTLTFSAGTGTNASNITFSAVSMNYIVTFSSANATIGAVYTSANSKTCTVQGTISSGTTLCISVAGVVAPTGNLSKSSGSGDATITTSAYVKEMGLLATFISSPARASVTAYTSSGAVLTYTGTFTGYAGTVTEIGLFNASSANVITMTNYLCFGGITVGTSDSISWTWTDTFSAS